MSTAAGYTGRFAPSPTGPLHFGSLLAALASYLDARALKGRWLIRIEDLDPPREQPGASDLILRTLDHFGLHWDGEVVYQSQRLELYAELLQRLIDQGLAYRCRCSRSDLKLRDALYSYDGHCRIHPPDAEAQCAIRALCSEQTVTFEDLIQDRQIWQHEDGRDDFIIFRRDGLFAYQLAVVADDHAQGVTRVIRGSDLLDETFRQLQLQQHLAYPTPEYGHIPILLNKLGQKLSKQNLAPALNTDKAVKQLWEALHLLGQNPTPSLQRASNRELLDWAVTHWQRDHIPRTLAIRSSGS
ncbi:tRNA glutamyl-Q(34) synthetase GluQRS [Nitrincola sp. MINF-07-Sa-05]|uniref:tRNA glutamyl-Q(34) synthetase GluQRS n=1 Tax=Nitrincola salilacus TaxID=3400273 RepID=UPI003918555B